MTAGPGSCPVVDDHLVNRLAVVPSLEYVRDPERRLAGRQAHRAPGPPSRHVHEHPLPWWRLPLRRSASVSGRVRLTRSGAPTAAHPVRTRTPSLAATSPSGAGRRPTASCRPQSAGRTRRPPLVGSSGLLARPAQRPASRAPRARRTSASSGAGMAASSCAEGRTGRRRFLHHRAAVGQRLATIKQPTGRCAAGTRRPGAGSSGFAGCRDGPGRSPHQGSTGGWPRGAQPRRTFGVRLSALSIEEDQAGSAPVGGCLIAAQRSLTQRWTATWSRSAARRTGRCTLRPRRWCNSAHTCAGWWRTPVSCSMTSVMRSRSTAPL